MSNELPQESDDNVEFRNPIKDADEDDHQSISTTTKVKLHVKKGDRLGDFEYVCVICGQKYVQKKALERHVALHGESNRKLCVEFQV